ncbi:YIP1 family protein [bacterium]|nr:YIP1 family protein [candidate division CSSED10-310 bacterium]
MHTIDGFFSNPRPLNAVLDPVPVLPVRLRVQRTAPDQNGSRQCLVKHPANLYSSDYRSFNRRLRCSAISRGGFVICPSCGKQIESSEAFFCPYCGCNLTDDHRIIESLKPASAPPFDTGGDSYEWEPAWERRAAIGYSSAFFQTIRDVLFHPTAVFSRLSQASGLGGSLLFAVAPLTLGIIASMIWQMLMNFATGGMAEYTGALDVQIYALIALVTMVAMPILAIMGIFISSAIYHLLLLLFASPRQFETTFKVIAYVQGATAVWLLVPFCGGLIQTVWSIAGMVIGFREAHGLSNGKAVLVVLLPMMICCGFGLLAAGAVLVVVMANM